jgi:WD40 repeat protein
VQIGAVVAGPFEGHGRLVSSVSFSHDGKRVASGSYDKTVRIWDVQTGAVVAGPFEGHSESVTSVAFSHDGKRVASGSEDKTVLIWDAQTGSVVAGPFQGHSDWVTSVAFSHDGKRVVSGSGDKTVQIWDAQRGIDAAGPFNGHSDWITSDSIPGQDVPVHGHNSPSTPFHLICDDTKLLNGWVLGKHGELLCWVPPIHRSALLRPNNLLLLGATATTLDATNFVHGDRWHECWTGPDK